LTLAALQLITGSACASKRHWIHPFRATVHFPQVARALGRDIYEVWVPQSTRAPHMAAEHRFYKRFNFESVPVEEYKVRYVSRSFLFRRLPTVQNRP